ncbi:hypothetical protein ABW636_13815 [Aquimarina sp. 2201CG1-2-11]|uniref:hypothetical protein n=1 Tax=Aquimarina discodermiae TaxID=3231043 RepID=UPI003461D23E
MNKLILLTLISGVLFSCSQQLNCTGLSDGNFVIPKDTEDTKPYKIIRNGDVQKEINDGIVTSYSRLKWLNPCSYVLTYDEYEIELTDFQKGINKAGGIIVEIIKVKGNCFYYTSNIKGDPPSERINGVMCKE